MLRLKIKIYMKNKFLRAKSTLSVPRSNCLSIVNSSIPLRVFLSGKIINHEGEYPTIGVCSCCRIAHTKEVVEVHMHM